MVKVLVFDIEGGYGGSSRSLYFVLQEMVKNKLVPTVICRKDGPVVEMYKSLGVDVFVEPEVLHASAVARASRNLFIFSKALFKWIFNIKFRKKIAKKISNFDLIHLNHEGLFLFGLWIRFLRPEVPITMHVRTLQKNNLFFRWQRWIICKISSHIFFITENERDNYKINKSYSVVYNVVSNYYHSKNYTIDNINSRIFNIGSLSNFDYVRGTDRLLDLAQEIKKRKINDVKIIVAGRGKAANSSFLFKRSNNYRSEHLYDEACRLDLLDIMEFVGHVREPLNVLERCNLVIKPTREANPWGRDIIEALSVGLPIMSVGSYRQFIRNGKNGYLNVSFNVVDWVNFIVSIKENKSKRVAYSVAAKAVASQFFDPCNASKEISNVWNKLTVDNKVVSGADATKI